MRIGCLQFAPRLGEVDNNLNEADGILSEANPEDLDLLVLPELAFTGYNFRSLHEIYPFLEPTVTGITSVWARNAALRYDCAVAVGYPETADVSHKWPTSPEYYNALIVVNRDGDTWAHYRKSHLYYTDESWALEGDGFWKGFMPGIGKIALGICMDINPYKFEAPWDQFEFATHALEVAANVIIVSMAWLTREEPQLFNAQPSEPDMETLTYWVKRMEPLIRSDDNHEVIVIFSNRAGTEGDATYAGTSAVLGIHNGEVTVYGLLGRGEKQLLVVDTSKPGFAKMVYRPDDDSQAIVGQENTQTASQDLFGPGSDTGHSSGNGEMRDPKLQSSGDRTLGYTAHRAGHRFAHSEEPSKEFFDEFPLGSSEEPSLLSTFSLESLSRELEGISGQSLSRADEFESLVDYHQEKAPTTDIVESPTFAALEPEPTAEFSDLIKTLQDPGPSQDVQVARPFSTKSRNASRTQSRTTNRGGTLDQPGFATTRDSFSREEDFDSATGFKTTVRRVPSKSQPDDVDDQEIYRPSPAQSSGPSRYNFRSEAGQIDMEKLGADLMVFEEGTANRIKRHSLVCHVDDDDYIVLRTMRQDGNPSGHKPSKSGRFPSRPSSRQTPRCSGSAGHDVGRSEILNTRSTGSSAPAKQHRSSQSRSTIRDESEFSLYSPARNLKNSSSSSDRYDSAAGPSFSSRSRQSSHRERFPRAEYSSQDHIVEHRTSVPRLRSGNCGGDSSHSPEGAGAASYKDKFVFSPKDMLLIDPDIHYSGTMQSTIGMGVTVAGSRSPADKASLTPKAMRLVVEPDE